MNRAYIYILKQQGLRFLLLLVGQVCVVSGVMLYARATEQRRIAQQQELASSASFSEGGGGGGYYAKVGGDDDDSGEDTALLGATKP